ncbi:YCF48-related protein [Zavarzinia compransoris]|uniref:WD40/YVTN/BNR-like repeat-containing protein n=1 Tax=Zavarzinia marina TaxID=2911065 RepID=UPI001F314782|nr:YCF48-related protein [Zavarzinia marina]MCF4165167.1 YCF48-related protein [Zavarzinia marina]
MAAFIAVVAVYAFYPRSLPEFPATAINASRLRVNGLAEVGTRLVAVGESGHILISDDRAASWRDAEVAPPDAWKRVDSTLTNVRFIDDDLGLALGHDGLVLRSSDKGETWSTVRFNPEYSDPLFDVCRTARGPIFAVGSFGKLLRSTDRGESFDLVDLDELLPDGPHLNDIACDGAGHIMISGEFAQGLRSADGGETWQPMQLPYNGSLYGVLAVSGGRWLMFGMRGHMFRSDDFGETWAAVDSGVETSLFGGLKLADGRLVVFGQGNTILLSEDGGASFRVEREGGRESLTTAFEIAPDRLLFGGEKGISQFTLGRPVAALAGGQ